MLTNILAPMLYVRLYLSCIGVGEFRSVRGLEKAAERCMTFVQKHGLMQTIAGFPSNLFALINSAQDYAHLREKSKSSKSLRIT